MELSAKGAEFVRHHEGFVPRYYLDPVGIPTIGIGFTWRSDSFREWWGRNRPGRKFGPDSTMTKAEADAALQYIVKAEYGKAVEKHLGRAVPQHVFDGAVSPVYNLGVGSLQWKWAAALKRRDYAEAATLLKTTGTTAQGKKLRGLVTRRKEEAELIEHGDYVIGNDATPADPMADGVLRKGERGKPVMDLQTALKALGHYDGAVDGIFGVGTQAAVLSFQRARSIKADGIAGPVTIGALFSEAVKPTQPTKPSPAPTAPEKSPKPIAGLVGLLMLAIAGVIAKLSGVF